MSNIHYFGGNSNFGGNGTFTTTQLGQPVQPFPSIFGVPIDNTQLIEIYNAILEGDEKKIMSLLNSLSIFSFSNNINETLNIPNNPFRYTLLHNAIDMRASTIVIKKLISLGADLNIKDKRGRTCFDLLSTCGNEQVIRDIYSAKDDQILEYKTKIQVKDLDIRTKDSKIELLNNDKKKLQEALDKVRLEKQNLQDEIMTSRKRSIDQDTEIKNLKEQKKKLIKQTKI
jgi:hypothetical protein